MTIPFLPSPHEEERLRVGQYDYRQWRVEEEIANPAPPIENIRFPHNANWRSGDFFSVTAIANGTHSNIAAYLFWQMIRWLFVAATGLLGASSFRAFAQVRGLVAAAILLYASNALWRSKMVTDLRFDWVARKHRKR